MGTLSERDARNFQRNAGLDEEFVAGQKERLEALKEALYKLRAGIEEDEREWSEDGRLSRQDIGDLNSYLRAQEIDATLEARLLRRERFVDRALQKIEEGTYGVCDDTGEPIPRGRLEAIPEAIYTVEAQRRRERRR